MIFHAKSWPLTITARPEVSFELGALPCGADVDDPRAGLAQRRCAESLPHTEQRLKRRLLSSLSGQAGAPGCGAAADGLVRLGIILFIYGYIETRSLTPREGQATRKW